MTKKPTPHEFDPWERLAELEKKPWDELTEEEQKESVWLIETIKEIEEEQAAWEKFYGEEE